MGWERNGKHPTSSESQGSTEFRRTEADPAAQPATDRNQFATARGMRIAGLGFTAQRSSFSARLVSTHCSVDSLPSGLRLKMPRKASICLCTSARDSFLGLAMHHAAASWRRWRAKTNWLEQRLAGTLAPPKPTPQRSVPARILAAMSAMVQGLTGFGFSSQPACFKKSCRRGSSLDNGGSQRPSSSRFHQLPSGFPGGANA